MCCEYKQAIDFAIFQSHFFDEYAMEGVSAESNEIYLEVVPDLLVRSLRTAHSAKWVKVKLTKKNFPCLTIEVDLVSSFCLITSEGLFKIYVSVLYVI